MSLVHHNPFCLGHVWHEWGACSYILPSANVQPLTFPIPEQFAFNHFEEELLDGCGLGVDHRPREGVANQRFAPPKSEEEIDRARLEFVPKKTRQDTEYCVRLWNAWAENRRLNTGVTIPPLEDYVTSHRKFS